MSENHETLKETSGPLAVATLSELRGRPSTLEPCRSTLWAGLGYLAIIAVLFPRLLLGEVLSPAANLWAEVPFRSELREDFTPYLNGVQGDVWREFEPWHTYQYRSARAGRFPLWNPHVFCGFPMHANGQSAMLSPFHWAYFVIDPKWAAGLVAALKLWVAGFATFCLGRRLGMVAMGAFVAGSAWMLSAFLVRWLLWNHSAAAALLPVVLVTLDALIEQVSLRRFALAGLAATALQLCGHPETQFHVGVLAGVYVLLRVWLAEVSQAATAGRILICAAAQMIGLLGAAAALLPFAEQVRESADWQESTHALGRSLPLEGLIGAVAPDHFGRPRAGRFYQGPLNYNEAGIYFGLVPLALALSVLPRLLIAPRRTRDGPAGHAVIIFTVWLLLCGVVVLGLPWVSIVLERLPLFSKADNLRLLLGVQFAGAMLAGAAWTQLTRSPSRLGLALLVVSTWGIAALLGVLMFVQGAEDLYSHSEGLHKLWTDSSVPAPMDHRSLRTLASLGFALLAAIWSLFCWRRMRHRIAEASESRRAGSGDVELHDRGRRTGPVGLCKLFLATPAGIGVILSVGDLAWVAYGFNPVVPARAIFPQPPTILERLAENSQGGRLIATDEILAPNLAMVYGFRDMRGYDFPLDRRWTKLFRRLGWKPGITLLPRYQVAACMRPTVQSVADKCSVRFLYTSSEPNAAPPPESLSVCDFGGISGHLLPHWKLIVRGVGMATDVVYQNPTPYPRAYLANRATFAGAETALDAVLNVAHDLREESFVEEQVGELVTNDDATPGAATIEFDEPEEVWIRTQSTSPRLLVLSDRYDPTWRVEIDGRAAQALRANYLFRGVTVPAGEHLIRWSYRPITFYWGCGLSAATLFALLVMAGRREPLPGCNTGMCF